MSNHSRACAWGVVELFRTCASVKLNNILFNASLRGRFSQVAPASINETDDVGLEVGATDSCVVDPIAVGCCELVLVGGDVSGVVIGIPVSTVAPDGVPEGATEGATEGVGALVGAADGGFEEGFTVRSTAGSVEFTWGDVGPIDCDVGGALVVRATVGLIVGGAVVVGEIVGLIDGASEGAFVGPCVTTMFVGAGVICTGVVVGGKVRTGAGVICAG